MAGFNRMDRSLDDLIGQLTAALKERAGTPYDNENWQARRQEQEGREWRSAEADRIDERKRKQRADLTMAQDRHTATVNELQRQGDAFEVTAGRMNPELYAMRYGGAMPGAGTGGTGKGSGKDGTGKGSDRDQMIMEALTKGYEAAAANRDMAAGPMEDFGSYVERNIGGMQKAFPKQAALTPQEQTQRNYAKQMDLESMEGDAFSQRLAKNRDGAGNLFFTDRGTTEERFGAGRFAPDPLGFTAGQEPLPSRSGPMFSTPTTPPGKKKQLPVNPAVPVKRGGLSAVKPLEGYDMAKDAHNWFKTKRESFLNR
jgi:hypothetical protein